MSLTWIAISLVVAGIILAFLYFAGTTQATQSSSKKRSTESKRDQYSNKNQLPSNKIGLPKQEGKSNPADGGDQNILEVFDYNGIKIIHDNGLWTVNDASVVQSFKDWGKLPPRYQKMVKELDNRSIQNQKQQDYFLEILNGFYYVSMPGGKKKKFNKFTDIPEDIRTFLGK